MLNQCTFIGNMTKDPEGKQFGANKMMATFSVAVTEKWKDANGEQKESTEFINCTAFISAKFILDYVKKGDKVYIEGKYKTEKWQDKNGNDRQSVKIIVNKFLSFAQKKSAGQGNNYQAPLNDDVPF